MKIFAITDNYHHFRDGERHRGPGWIYLPDSSIFRAPNPFFPDDENDSVMAFPSLAVRIDRLGKSIASKFAPRYSGHAALAVNFRNLTLEEELRNAGLPVDPAWGFDRSLLLSDWKELTLEEMENSSIILDMIDEENDSPAVIGSFDWKSENLLIPIAEIIEEVSRRNILKMGDVILCGLPTMGLRLSTGSRLQCSLRVSNEVTDSVSIAVR